MIHKIYSNQLDCFGHYYEDRLEDVFTRRCRRNSDAIAYLSGRDFKWYMVDVINENLISDHVDKLI